MKTAFMSEKWNIVLTCEHASRLNAPECEAYIDFLDYDDHEIFDAGAEQLANWLKDKFKAPLYSGEVSRLVIDLNRSLGKKPISKCFGSIDHPEYAQLIDKYYYPFRNKVENKIALSLPCIHLSIHSFTRSLKGQKRHTDIGILYDPQKKIEKNFSKKLIDTLKKGHFTIHANRPYRGTSDGHTTYLRKIFPKKNYLGIEIEVCQDLMVNSISEIEELLFAGIQSAIADLETSC